MQGRVRYSMPQRGRSLRRRGDIAEALSAAASWGPATVRELAARAQVGYAAARYTESRMVARGELVRICTGRPALVALPDPADERASAAPMAARAGRVCTDWWQQLCTAPGVGATGSGGAC
jgi:hypothetical protein